MDRRSYLTKSDLLAPFGVAAERAIQSGEYAEAHRLFEEAQRKMAEELGDPAKTLGMTSASVRIVCACYEPTEVKIDLPPGFVPCAIDSTYTACECYEIELIDNEGSVIKVIESAFNSGALLLWRATVGELRCRITWLEYPSCIPPLSVTIYGTIHREP